jgi:prepilin-type N-terminal cleavage/methylation domain-containing protein
MPPALIRSGFRPRGFTLVELAVVLAIITLLLGGLVVTVAAQLELQHTAETRQTLDNVRDALTGFAVATGRLPCPATDASNGQESYTIVAGAFACTNGTSGVAHGFVPGVTLGATPLDSQGYVLDGWGFRVRYSVFTATISTQPYPFTTPNGMRTVGMGTLSGSNLLYVCSKKNGTTTNNCGMPQPPTDPSKAALLTLSAPAVIYSTGKNTATGGTSDDEGENPNPNSGDADIVFVFHDVSTATGNEFDDMMTWISLPVLFSRMIAAGQLP